MQEELARIADLLRPRAEVEFTENGLLVVVEGRKATQELIALVKAQGLHVHNVMPVVAGHGDPYSFEVTTYRTYDTNELREISGFPESGYSNHHPYASKRVGDWWFIFTWVRDDSTSRFLLFKSRSPFTWRIEGTEPKVWGQLKAPYILVDPADPNLQARIQEFIRTA